MSSTARTYDGIHAGGHARVHLGDVVNYQPPDRASLEHKTRVASSDHLLESLSFRRMDAHLRNIAAAVPHTCQWVRYTRESQQWEHRISLDPNGGILSIKGSSGSG